MSRPDESRLRLLEAEAHKELLPLTQQAASVTAAGVVAHPPSNGRSTKGLQELLEEEQLSDFIPGLGMFLFRRDKHSRKRRAEFLQLGRSQKAKIVKLTYEIIENVCAKVCPGGQGDLLDSIARIHKTYRRRRLSNMALQQGLSASSPSSAASHQGLLSAIDEELGGAAIDASTAMGAEHHLLHNMPLAGSLASAGALGRHPIMGDGVTSSMRTAAGLMDLARRGQVPMGIGMASYASSSSSSNPSVRSAYGAPANYYDSVVKAGAFMQRGDLGSGVPSGYAVDAMSGSSSLAPATHEPNLAFRHAFESDYGSQESWRAPVPTPAISEEALILSNLWRSSAAVAPALKHQDQAFATVALGQKPLGGEGPAARPSLAV